MTEGVEGIEIRRAGGERLAVHGAFERASRTVHGFSLRRADGSLPDLASSLCAAGLDGARPATLRQVHGGRILIRDAADGDGPAPDADGHASRDRDLALVVRSADCVPLLVADPETGAAGAAHAGWRGTAAGIAQRLVRGMTRAFGSRPSRLVALLGPAIGPCCYEIGEDVAGIFRERFDGGDGILGDSSSGPGGAARLDLVAANRRRLVEAGLPAAGVMTARLCTACRTDLFPSYRAEGRGAGRLWSLIRPAGA